MTRTIGVSVPVPEPWGSDLQRRREGYGDPRASATPTHVTLLPPTVVRRARSGQLRDHLRAAAAGVEPFTLVLRGTGTFAPVSPVVYVQLARGVSGCEQLERAIRRGPMKRRLDFPYHPHVTVAHAIDEAALDRAFADLAGFTCEFTVSHIDLYELGEDEVWRPQEAFPLGAAAASG